MDNPFQNNGEWLMERCGKLTASRMADAMDFLKTGKPSAAQLNYAMELVTERMTGSCAERFVNDAMKWGIETEPEAREEYINLTGNQVELVGFLEHAFIEYCGASPDGLVTESMSKNHKQEDCFGLLEIKCPTSQTHLQWVLDGVVPEKHKPQMLLQMSVTGRAWCDFFSYDPRCRAKPSFLIRYTPTVEEIANVEAHAMRFLKYVDELFEKITGA